jgi:protein gp37
MIRGAFKSLDKINIKAWNAGRKDKVFVGSMMDIFEKPMPLSNVPMDDIAFDYENTGQLRDELLYRIGIEDYPALIFQLLTKRPAGIRQDIPKLWYDHCPESVWFGVSAATQTEYIHNVVNLGQCAPNSANLFVSIEPMIEAIDPRSVALDPRFKWIIIGGESGSKARRFDY